MATRRLAGLACTAVILAAGGAQAAQPAATPPVPTRRVPQPEPSADAVRLAEALAVDNLPLMPFPTVQQLERNLASRMLDPYRPGEVPCARRNTECVRAATEIAAREAPRLRERLTSVITRAYAVQFDANMTGEQMRTALGFVRTPDGQAFAQALRSTGRQDVLMGVIESAGGSFDTMYEGSWSEEFRRRTAHLPRATRVPPPAPPPVPPRPPRGPNRPADAPADPPRH